MIKFGTGGWRVVFGRIMESSEKAYPLSVSPAGEVCRATVEMGETI